MKGQPKLALEGLCMGTEPVALNRWHMYWIQNDVFCFGFYFMSPKKWKQNKNYNLCFLALLMVFLLHQSHVQEQYGH